MRLNTSKQPIVVCIISALIGLATAELYAEDAVDDWVVPRDFSITLDTQGYELPSAIAFVPNPGTRPEDPLYFVTELRGRVKVVTNDRTTHVFAEDFVNFTPARELPEGEGENGLAGICLDPERGYVFVTFAYQDDQNTLRNNIVRFDSVPGVFSNQPESRTEFTEVLAPYASASAHQVGACQVHDGLLYVSVGDGWNPAASQSFESLLGKIIRLTVDGEPAPGNPYADMNESPDAADYIWALGLRNPFGLTFARNRLFVAGNGPSIDRFIEIEKGENYLWDGSNWSTGTNSAFIFAPAVSPVHLDYFPGDSTAFPPNFRDKFYVALSGKPKAPPGPDPATGAKSIVVINYDFSTGRLVSVPEHFVRFRGNVSQMIVGLAVGPDGLYFAPLFPNGNGVSGIFKVTHDPENPHKYLLDQKDAATLMQDGGCFGCHGWGENALVQIGPNLAVEHLAPRLEARLVSKEYAKQLIELDKLNVSPYPEFSEARRRVAEAEGIEQLRLWLTYKIQEPKFDNPRSQMQNSGFSPVEAQIIADYLLSGYDKLGVLNDAKQTLKQLIGKPSPARIVQFFVFGFVAGIMFVAGLILVRVFVRRTTG